MHYCIYILLLIPICFASNVHDVRRPNFVNHHRLSQLACPCEDASLCDPIPPANGKTRLAYTRLSSNWKYYDFTKITELILFFDIAEMDPEVICVAHKNNVQLHLGGFFGNETFLDPSKQEEWIQDHLKMLTDNHLDGINVDYEQFRKPEWETYLVGFMVELSKRIKSMNSNYQLTYCLPTDPERYYDFVTIPTIMDYLLIMDYDQVWSISPDDCYATANQQPLKTIYGLTKFLKLGIPPSKLVIGMPWYGYIYTCENITSDGKCSLKNCPYVNTRQTEIPKVYQKYELEGNYKLQQGWDDTTLTPYLTIIPKDEDVFSVSEQFWYDNGFSLTRKAEVYKPYGFRGIGAFHVDCLNYTIPEMQPMNKRFWHSFTVFQD